MNVSGRFALSFEFVVLGMKRLDHRTSSVFLSLQFQITLSFLPFLAMKG